MQESPPNPTAPSWAPGLRFATAEIAPVEFGFRRRPEDFVVRELPGCEPSGEGDHVHVEVEKCGVATTALADRLAREFDLPTRDIGFAGRKDAFAVTRQRFSIPTRDIERVRALAVPGVRVLDAWRHTERLSLGELAGNRFELRLAGVDDSAQATIARALEVLGANGMPNYFGDQRFGRTGRAWELGRELLVGRDEAYVRGLCAPEHAGEGTARTTLFEAVRGTPGQRRGLTRIAHHLPADLRRLAVQLARRPRDIASALRAVDKRDRRFHLTALQSRIFNRVCAWRVGDPDARPEDVLVEVPGRSSGVPSGPLPGRRNLVKEGRTGEEEAAALGLEGLTQRDLERRRAGIRLKGVRRALRVLPGEPELRRDGPDVWLAFTLPPGSYATVLVAELRKSFRVDPSEDPGHAGPAASDAEGGA